MAGIQDTEIWRQIPPEEKIQTLSRAHGRGIMAAVITIIIASTIAIGLKLPWMMWGSIIFSPFIFQFAAGKAWRDARPRMMLEYLAARAAARRYAYSCKGNDLTVSLLFRGKMEELYSEEHAMEALEATINKVKEAEVWVALFNDALVLMSEEPGGARLRFGHVLNDKVSLEAVNSDEKSDYSANKEIILSLNSKNDTQRRIKLTSKYPAAMVVFEKRFHEKQAAAKEAEARRLTYEAEEAMKQESEPAEYND